jgi:DNA-binding transcriptional regulator GbsR (MarR family)
MHLDEAKLKFINSWGTLGSQWGINRTMSQIHALLLVTSKPLSAEEIMEQLGISRGNANMNLRELMNWTLINKELVPGDRKEYFVAEKDIWEIAKIIARERKRREIEPVLKVLNGLKDVDGDQSDKEVKAFTETVNNLSNFVGKMDKSVDMMLKADENWFFGTILKMIK